MRRQLEYAEHVSFYTWCQYQKDIEPFIFAIEHGEVRNKITGAKLKRKGVKKGMADYFFICPNKKYNGLWLEFKVGDNKQSPAQIHFEKLVKECNYQYKCVYSTEEAIKILEKYKKNT